MKFSLALLATLVLSGSGSLLRPQQTQPKNQVEAEWSRAFPEIDNPKVQERIFKDGSEYRYLYDSQILTGMPDIHAQFSGARIRAVVRIQLGQKDLMQIEKVFVGSLHERFVSEPQNLVDLSAFEPMNEQDAPFEEVLRKPIRFNYENGKINNFETTEDDPSWSINIKRAILATFHLSLTDREQPRDESRRDQSREDESNMINKRQRVRKADEDEDEYFTVVEDGVAGRCEVSYLVMEIPDEEEANYNLWDTELVGKQGKTEDSNVLNVTKTFDYRNCEFRPFVFRGLHMSSACPGCDETESETFFEFLESSAHTRYNITGTKQQYIIDSAITEAVYKFTPRSHYAGSLVAYANITVTLMESGSAKAPINFPEQNANKIDGLHMIDPKFARREGDKVLYETPEASRPILQKREYWPNVDQKAQKVKALFEKLVQGMEQREIESETAVLAEEITRFLEYAFTEELQQIHAAVKTVSVAGVEKEEIEHLFADLLAATGTNCTFTYLKKLLVEKQLQGPVVSDVLAVLPFRMNIERISPETLKQWMEMCEHESMQVNQFVKRSCWLSFGTLVHKVCGHNAYDSRVEWAAFQADSNRGSQGEQQPSESRARLLFGSRSGEQDTENLRCPPEVRERIVQKTTQILKSAKKDDEELRVLVIKVIGNMGLNETVDELAEIIEDDNTPVYIRTQAIYALKHVAAEEPELVLDILLPLYRHANNPTQVRIAAFIIMLAAQPDLPLLEDIAQSLNREPDLDVASYVYSSMSSLANSTDPCLKNLTRDLILALEHATPVNADMRHSKSIHKGQFFDNMKRGLFWEANYVAARDAPAPRSANFRLHANLMDKSLDLVEFGFETEGFGDSLRKYIKNITSESLEKVLKGNAPRRPRQAGQEQKVDAPEISQIDELLNLQSKDAKELRGTAYVKLFGQETRFAVINPQTVSRFLIDLISQSDSVLPKLTGEGLTMDQRRASLLVDARVEVPTVLGVPISNSIRVPIVASMKGKVKVNVEPKPTEGFGFGMFKQAPHRLLIENEVKANLAAEVHTKLSVFLGFIKIGTGVRLRMSVNAPINGKVELHLKDRMTKFTMDLPESPLKLAKLESIPVTYVIRLSKNAQTYQPEQIPSGQLSPRRSDSLNDYSDESAEVPRSRQQQSSQQQGERFLSLNITDAASDLLTKTGHVVFPKWAGLALPDVELWEIATPAFVKARKIHLQVGHESMAAKLDIKSEMEYPNTRIPTTLLPEVGAKAEIEVKLTPKQGARKIIVTAYERTEFSTKTEKELLNKLKDKVADLHIKELERPNAIKDLEKSAKLGHSLQVLINAEGSDAPDAWTTRGLLALIYTMDGRYTKLVGGINSKLSVLPKKFCLTGELRAPERNGMWFLTPEQPLNKSIQGNLEMSWGEDCGAEKFLKLRMRLQKTKEQVEVEKNDLYDVNGIPVPAEVASEVREGQGLFESLYKRCEEDRQRGAFFSQECVEFTLRYTDLLRLKVDVEYKNVSRAIRTVLHKLERVTKGMYYWNTEVQDVDVQNQENRVNALIEFSADRSYVDIKYQTPRQNVSMINLELPYDVMPASALIPWNYARIFGRAQPVTCTLSGPKIDTFDDVSDEMPLSQCWHLLTKDASDDDTFAVLVANAAKNSHAKKIAVVFKGHRIEIIPAGNAQSTPQNPISIKNFVVKYNGQELSDVLIPEKRTTIPPNTPEDKQEVADIMLIKPETSGNREPIVAIISQVTGLAVLFDGSSVTVLPSPFWKDSLVGLCGSYNGQPWDDKLLPNKTLVEEPQELSRAFLLNQAGCDAEISPVPQSGASRSKSQQRA